VIGSGTEGNITNVFTVDEFDKLSTLVHPLRSSLLNTM